MKLKRLGAGQYATEDGRYLIEQQDGITECSHPMCWELHQRFLDRDGVHWTTYVAWHVWDTVRDDYAGHEEFATKREAEQWLSRLLEEKVAETFE